MWHLSTSCMTGQCDQSLHIQSLELVQAIYRRLVISTSLIANNLLPRSENLVLRSFFSSFPQYFQYISNFRSQFTYSFVKCGCSIYFFPNSANLICQGTDVSKFYESPLEFEVTRVNNNVNSPEFTKWMHRMSQTIHISLHGFLFNDTSTLVGHFVLSPRGRKK